MPRQTRAAARAAEAEQVSQQDIDVALPQPSKPDHEPPREIIHGHLEEAPETEPQIQDKPAKKSKRGRKPKGRKANKPDATTLDAQDKEELGDKKDSLLQEDQGVPRNPSNGENPRSLYGLRRT